MIDGDESGPRIWPAALIALAEGSHSLSNPSSHRGGVIFEDGLRLYRSRNRRSLTFAAGCEVWHDPLILCGRRRRQNRRMCGAAVIQAYSLIMGPKT